MPLCCVETSFPDSFFPDDFMTDFVTFLSKLLGKPFDHIIASLVADQRLWIRDQSGGIVVRLVAMGVFKELTRRRQLAREVGGYLSKHLSLPLDRIVIDVKHAEVTEIAMRKPVY